MSLLNKSINLLEKLARGVLPYYGYIDIYYDNYIKKRIFLKLPHWCMRASKYQTENKRQER